MLCCHLIQLMLMLQCMQPKAFTTICCNGIRVFVFGIISHKWALQCVMHYSTRGNILLSISTTLAILQSAAKKGTLFPLCFGVPCLSKRDLLDRKRIFCVCNNIYSCEMKSYSTSYTLAWIL